MPHLILEYSANLTAPDLPALFAGLHEALATLGIALDDCKSRAYRCDAYRVGTGAPERAFAHLTPGAARSSLSGDPAYGG